MPTNWCLGQDLVGRVRFFAQCSSGVEAVDEERSATFTVGVREEMEHLQAGWVGEIGRVGVGWEGEVGVGGIFHGEVCCEVIEAT